jgi:thiol:disulfide interchange protein
MDLNSIHRLRNPSVSTASNHLPTITARTIIMNHPRTLLLLITLLLSLAPSIARAQPDVVRASAATDHSSAPRGSSVLVSVVLDHDEGWHTNTHAPKVPASWAATGFSAWPTSLTMSFPEWAEIRGIQWPKTHTIKSDLAGTGVEEPYDVWEGRAVILVSVSIGKTAPLGAASLPVSIEYQSCSDTCLPPTTKKIEVRLTITDSGSAPVKSADLSDFAGADEPAFIAPPVIDPEQVKAQASAAPVEVNVLGYRFSFQADGLVGRITLMGVALLGGLLLNLMPCVLPVIPIKIMSLQKSAQNPTRAFRLGVMTALGVVAFWVAIGLVIGFSTSFKAASQLIAIWWFTLGIGIFIACMSVGMLGLFTIELPQSVYSINAKQDSDKGSFSYGILTAILSLPCVAPFAGSAMSVAAYRGPVLAVAIFLAIGVGMSLPWVLLAARPDWLSFVPKAGPASDLLKQVMGLLMLAAAIFFIGSGLISLVATYPFLAKQLHWWVIALVVGAAAVWMVMRTFQIATSGVSRAVVSCFGAFLVFAGFGWAWNQTRNAMHERLWVDYSPEVVQEAMAAGKVVVVDFTAEWCGICKSLESAVLHREPVLSALQEEGVVAVKVDLSSLQAPGWKYLAEQKESGIPLLIIQGPGTSTPTKSNLYTSDWVMKSIETARGQVESSNSPAEAVSQR